MAQPGLPYYTLADLRNNSKHKIPLVEQLNETDADRRIREPAKENADFVTDGVDEDGVRNALHHFGVI